MAAIERMARTENFRRIGAVIFIAGNMLRTLTLVALGSTVVAVLPLQAFAESSYLAPGGEAKGYPYTYENTFPKGTGDFPSQDQVGGEVFAPGPGPGDKFPIDITVYDLNDKPVPLNKFLNQPLVLACFYLSAPSSIEGVVNLQKVVAGLKGKYNVIALNIQETVGVLAANELLMPWQNSTGRSLRATLGKQIQLPVYYLNNSQYDPKGFTNTLRLRDLPTVYVLNTDGTIKKVYSSEHTRWSRADF